MPSIAEALDIGFNMEVDWNAQQMLIGYSFLRLPIPSLRYRLFRAAHMAQMAGRENLALAIAPWLEPSRLP